MQARSSSKRAFPALRWLLFLSLVALAPVPFFLALVGFAPIARLGFLTGLVATLVWREGGGQMSHLLLGIASAQLAAYLVLAWVVATLLARVGVALAPRRAFVIALAGALLGASAVSVLPVYHVPFGLDSLDATLLDLYVPPGRVAIPPPPADAGDFGGVASDAREPCEVHDLQRRPWFGDLHVHTALSFDSVGQGTRNRPRDAYRFARGEAIGIQPYDRSERPAQEVRLRRPMDFAMVSDHAELLGETHDCHSPGSRGYDAYVCWFVRSYPRLAYMAVNGDMYSNSPPVRYAFCGDGGEQCLESALAPWREIQRAAEEAYDRSAACRFTSFVGFEWTGMPGGNNAHRNVVFRNATVPPRPINYLDTPTEMGLWRELGSRCNDRGDGCEALAIPHNSNVSNGRLFRIEDEQGRPLDAERARLRSQLEVLAEVTQHKGDSECRFAVDDPLCDFETPLGSTMQEIMSQLRVREAAPLSFVREVLGEGLVQEARLGANPFRFGLIGSTDTHLGTPGLVDEDQFVGHAAGIVSRLVEVPTLPDFALLNPGGLAVLWAEENSRDSLFDAMRRREAYGTSGPRLLVRFFGGWDYPESLCESDAFAASGYAGGVPMGGVLPPAPEGRPDVAPRFAVWALKDAGTPDWPGTDLQRIQIVKVWAEAGASFERVYDVVGSADGGADVDLATCTPRGPGFDQLCRVWRDPDFDSSLHAAYYARVVENPSCRWTTFACNAKGVDCEDPASFEGDLAACCDPTLPRTIQERAWASPIWYVPGGGDVAALQKNTTP